MKGKTSSETIQKSATLVVETNEMVAQSRKDLKNGASTILLSKVLIERSRMLLEAGKRRSP